MKVEQSLNKGMAYLTEEIIDITGLTKTEVIAQLASGLMNDSIRKYEYGDNIFWSLKT